jgi:predicted nucleic acid-binding protein
MLDVVVDASCLLKLLATRREVEIVRALNWQMISPELALNQVQYLRTPPDDDGQRASVAADLGPLVSAGLVTARRLADDWMDAFVECAVELDDADAACVALAATLGAPLVSDDRKLRRIARERRAGLVLIGTLDFLVEAVKALGLDDAASAQIVFDLRWQGNFLPRGSETHAAWFNALFAQHAGG